MSLHRKSPDNDGSKSPADIDKEILLQVLGLQNYNLTPLDLTTMLYISTPCLEDCLPSSPEDLPHTFLQRLWLLHPQSRSPTCQVPFGAYGVARPLEADDDPQSAVNPLDLIMAVYLATNSFLRQEITHRMVQCNFAVPLFLPPVWPEAQGTLLLCPFRDVIGQWTSSSGPGPRGVTMKSMADSRMPLLSVVRLGSCSVSKSRVLNRILGCPGRERECFTHRAMGGGQLPRVLSEGLVEVGWNLPAGDLHDDTLPQPLLMANLRGDAASCRKQLSLLCYSSAVLIVFCGDVGTKEQELLASWRTYPCQMVLVDCLMAMEEESKGKRNVDMMQKLAKDLELPEGSVLYCCDGNEDELAQNLREKLSELLPHLHSENLVGIAGIANDLNLTVDEDEMSRAAFSEVEKVLEGMENGMTKFMEEQLPLQGATWRRWSELEKVESRLQETFSQQEVAPGLKDEKEGLLELILEYKLTPSMRAFIEALGNLDTTKRAFFLSWMKVKLEFLQLEQLSAVAEPESERPQGLCLGLEHFLREMGLVYERYFRSPNYDLYEMFRLPFLAAELLLHGVPLEIYDGDASTLPVNWVYSVLFEVYQQLPTFSRMRVLTTLGFQRSRNAEVLSALFGVNFPKWGRRKIKGAYMVLLTLPDNLRMDMGCEFLMLISTEGLNAPEARQDNNSIVRDNELATFVTALSDVTLVNLPPEGHDEMHTNLKIAVSTLIRTKDIERRPVFQLASEGIGKDAKTLSCVIQTLAMEEASEGPQQDESSSSGPACVSHSLAGPWTRPTVPPQADHTYSDAALQLKQSLLAAFHRRAATIQPTCIGAFMEHMCKVWEAVKKENFPIGFSNIASADVLCDLCAKVVEGEQTFEDHMNVWVDGVGARISEITESDMQRGNDSVNSANLLRRLKEEGANEMKSQNDKIQSNVWEHLRQKDIDLNLVEVYRKNLFSRLDRLQEATTEDVNKKLELAIARHDLSTKLHALLTALEAALEVKLRSLLESYGNSNTLIDDRQLEEEFLRVWEDIPSNFNPTPFTTEEVIAKVTELLKKNLTSRGLKKPKIKFKNSDQLKGFTVKNGHFALHSKMKRTLKLNKEAAQRFTNNLIEDCNRRISEKLRYKDGYTDNYLRDVLGIIDKDLEVLKLEPFEMKSKFEVDVKVYICSGACHAFLAMQQQLSQERQAKEGFLSEERERHMQDFIYQFHKRHQCLQAAQTFTALCLRPTSLNFIDSSLERQVLEYLLKRDDAQLFSSPQKFHYLVLRDLLLEDSLERFLEYFQSTETVTHGKIEEIVTRHLSGSVMIEDRREQSLQQMSLRTERAIVQASEDSGSAPCSARLLLENVCAIMESPGDVTVPRAVLQESLFDIGTHREHFVSYLLDAVAEMSHSLTQEFAENEDVIEVPDDLPLRLQDMLHQRVRGCGQQCPFCKAPCDLEGREHLVHQVLLHRPKGLVSYTCANSASLSHSTCSADMAGDSQFLNRHTEGQMLPYKDYLSIYPDWSIEPDEPGGAGGSGYWRYVLSRFNSGLAQVYQCEPAALPKDWPTISQQEALESLQEAYHVAP